MANYIFEHQEAPHAFIFIAIIIYLVKYTFSAKHISNYKKNNHEKTKTPFDLKLII